jgi:hypothetical protein
MDGCDGRANFAEHHECVSIHKLTFSCSITTRDEEYAIEDNNSG